MSSLSENEIKRIRSLLDMVLNQVEKLTVDVSRQQMIIDGLRNTGAGLTDRNLAVREATIEASRIIRPALDAIEAQIRDICAQLRAEMADLSLENADRLDVIEAKLKKLVRLDRKALTRAFVAEAIRK